MQWAGTPMYVGWTATYLGITLMLRSVWLLVLLLRCALISDSSV
jgi:protein-S-isoprenylcysteine O-methyltransferase Ste14